MWNNNNQSGFHSQDNNRGFDNQAGFFADNNKGFGFDNFSGLKPMHNQDNYFQCHQNYTGSRLEACLQGVPWTSRSGRGGGFGCC